MTQSCQAHQLFNKCSHDLLQTSSAALYLIPCQQTSALEVLLDPESAQAVANCWTGPVSQKPPKTSDDDAYLGLSIFISGSINPLRKGNISDLTSVQKLPYIQEWRLPVFTHNSYLSMLRVNGNICFLRDEIYLPIRLADAILWPGLTRAKRDQAARRAISKDGAARRLPLTQVTRVRPPPPPRAGVTL